MDLTSLPFSSTQTFDFAWITNPEAWVALLTLTVMEVVLGIDNIVFLSILADKLPESERPRARFLGLGFAMVTRILLLLSLSWVMRLDHPLFGIFNHQISGKDLILILGGLFLLVKATTEIHHKVEGRSDGQKSGAGPAVLWIILVQIAILDIVFSLDSVITAVGMVDDIMVMVVAVMVSVGFMMLFAGPVNRFISGHPTVKVLALAFLLLIGTTLIAEGFHFHFEKGYVYFAMAFSVFVEIINLRVRARSGDGPAPRRD